MRKVMVLFGGCSGEYGVSLKSAAAIIKGLDRSRYEVIPVGITKDGRWLRFQGETELIREDRWEQEGTCAPAFIAPSRAFRGLLILQNGKIEEIPVDVVLPVLHGDHGEDGTVAGLLELAGIPYAGCGVLASAAGMDKDIARRLVQSAGVEVARGETFYAGDDRSDMMRRVWRFQYPLYVKPACGGSSIGLTRVDEPSKLLTAVNAAFQCDSKILIEEGVPGFEVGCAVLGSFGSDFAEHGSAGSGSSGSGSAKQSGVRSGSAEPFVGAVDEIQLHGVVFDYKEKYNFTKTVLHVPARIDAETAEEIKRQARLVYRVLGCRGLARIDFFLTPAGQIVFNEINTMPGFTEGSRYPKMLMAAGLTFSEILDRMINDALAGKDEKPSEAVNTAAVSAAVNASEEIPAQKQENQYQSSIHIKRYKVGTTR